MYCKEFRKNDNRDKADIFRRLYLQFIATCKHDVRIGRDARIQKAEVPGFRFAGDLRDGGLIWDVTFIR